MSVEEIFISQKMSTTSSSGNLGLSDTNISTTCQKSEFISPKSVHILLGGRGSENKTAVRVKIR